MSGVRDLVSWRPLQAELVPPRQLLSADRENLLVVTQVLANLRYNDPRLLTNLGGREAMIESPLIQEIVPVNCRPRVLKDLC